MEAEQSWSRAALLHLPRRTYHAEGRGALDRGHRRDFKIVSRSPQPKRVVLCRIRSYGQQDLALSGGVYVVRRFFRGSGQSHMLPAERLLNFAQVHRLAELNVDSKGMSVKDRALHQH